MLNVKLTGTPAHGLAKTGSLLQLPLSKGVATSRRGLKLNRIAMAGLT
jgi:hypothetical protein